MFEDRIDAALALYPSLHDRVTKDTLVVGIPNGGMVIAHVLSKALHTPLGFVLVKRIPHPVNKKYAVGAVNQSSVKLFAHHGISKKYLDTQCKIIERDLANSAEYYSLSIGTQSFSNKDVIIVDDGIASGATALSAIEYVKKYDPKSITVAVPVGSPIGLNKIEDKVDNLISLLQPPEFRFVSTYYENFKTCSLSVIDNLIRHSKNIDHQKTIF
ncbi:phosphoribosyltransferase family protein [Mangrovivirga sp. M17]|uniref:Phosphoribosyltransferase family protein n=1 Tax=Mangrovivirga halotolerans TaxID=2993936 RepID=A0ABT3RLC3_9BACT|nr:phosphoribosyltransferase family protein [Mangrovivirga halotolerans]MCX2742595.1 phosphoribosyltransferase family protein [Mangrovivirga halotolerans]